MNSLSRRLRIAKHDFEFYRLLALTYDRLSEVKAEEGRGTFETDHLSVHYALEAAACHEAMVQLASLR